MTGSLAFFGVARRTVVDELNPLQLRRRPVEEPGAVDEFRAEGVEDDLADAVVPLDEHVGAAGDRAEAGDGDGDVGRAGVDDVRVGGVVKSSEKGLGVRRRDQESFCCNCEYRELIML